MCFVPFKLPSCRRLPDEVAAPSAGDGADPTAAAAAAAAADADGGGEAASLGRRSLLPVQLVQPPPRAQRGQCRLCCGLVVLISVFSRF